MADKVKYTKEEIARLSKLKEEVALERVAKEKVLETSKETEKAIKESIKGLIHLPLPLV